MIDLKCVECGCIIPPDATKCPNCGYKYAEVKVSLKLRIMGTGLRWAASVMQLHVLIHGKIHVTATVASPPTSCPFC